MKRIFILASLLFGLNNLSAMGGSIPAAADNLERIIEMGGLAIAAAAALEPGEPDLSYTLTTSSTLKVKADPMHNTAHVEPKSLMERTKDYLKGDGHLKTTKEEVKYMTEMAKDYMKGEYYKKHPEELAGMVYDTVNEVVIKPRRRALMRSRCDMF